MLSLAILLASRVPAAAHGNTCPSLPRTALSFKGNPRYLPAVLAQLDHRHPNTTRGGDRRTTAAGQHCLAPGASSGGRFINVRAAKAASGTVQNILARAVLSRPDLHILPHRPPMRNCSRDAYARLERMAESDEDTIFSHETTDFIDIDRLRALAPEAPVISTLREPVSYTHLTLPTILLV